ncbi:MAG: VWA domain-containing protein [Spirochaetes bacterium]|nr:VWA domain-containing protein [Spirochaetota bacterium]
MQYLVGRNVRGYVTGAAGFMTTIVFAVILVLAGCAGRPGLTTIDAVLKPVDSSSGGSELERDEEAAPVLDKASERAESGPAMELMATEDAKETSGAPTPSAAAAPSVAAKSLGSGGLVRPPESSGLQAGFSDDNAQFNYFVDFLGKYDHVPHFPYDISERLGLKLVDSAGKTVPNAMIKIYAAAGNAGMAKGLLLASGLTFADGLFRFYPAALDAGRNTGAVTRYIVEVESGGQRLSAAIDRDGPRQVELQLNAARRLPSPLPLDVLFVMDTTGSMGEEIERLRSTIQIIYYNLAALKPAPELRFGLVLYKDVGDEYVTEKLDFTSDLNYFQDQLNKVYAIGGGDGPEDLQAALAVAVREMSWNAGGIRTAFVVTDAEAHLDYGYDYDYIDAANDARAAGIKIHTIGTGGLPLEGEYLLRQVSQLTNARYIFLTYGEQGESSGGTPSSVSHHTGANYQTDKLEAIIMRFVKEEVAWLSDTPPVIDNDFFTADSISSESRDETLTALFTQALGNLLDYSSVRVDPADTCAILPIALAGEAADAGLPATAEYFSARLNLTAATVRRFRLVERNDLPNILRELELQLTGMFTEETTAQLGEMLGAELLVTGQLYKRSDSYELFLQLLRVSTAEVLSVTRAVIDSKLGL